MRFFRLLRTFLIELSRFPFRNTALTLRDRFREDHMGLTASSLTFTTSIALVPFFTVALAIFTAFPIFSRMEGALQAWLVQSLIPDNIARQVLGYLTLFSRQANRLGAAGLAALLVSTTALVLTIDRTLNAIWRVKKPRPLTQRVLIYWSAITLGPVLLAASIAFTTYVLSASTGLVGVLPAGVNFMLNLLQFLLVAFGMAALYHYVPNTYVKWPHACAGGFFVACGIGLAKKLLTGYLGKVPTYSLIYGAFATLPILLVWIYLAWIIVLLGAVIAAYLPSLLAGISRRGGAHGWQFQLALEVLQELHGSRRTAMPGRSGTALAHELQVDVLQLEPVLEALTGLEWVGKLIGEGDQQLRYILLADPERTPLQPLLEALLLDKTPATAAFWTHGGWDSLTLAKAL